MMNNNCILITGCGRSGTKFISTVLNEIGMDCGHERVFSANSERHQPFFYESSWYGAPFISKTQGLTHVLHIVRDPRKVMASFYRIGLCSPTLWRHITYGHPLRFMSGHLLKPAATLRRIEFVLDHRRFLKEHTTVMDHSDEVRRLETYWVQWNELIEKSAKREGVAYLRVRLEDYDRERKSIQHFLGTEKELPLLEAQNHKSKYGTRQLPEFELSAETISLANRYGYDA
jgi:hypothetical protein